MKVKKLTVKISHMTVLMIIKHLLDTELEDGCLVSKLVCCFRETDEKEAEESTKQREKCLFPRGKEEKSHC